MAGAGRAIACALVATAALLGGAPAPARAGSAAALDNLTGLRDPATGGLLAAAGAATIARRAQDGWAALAVVAAGEDPRLWRLGSLTLRSAAGPRPPRSRPVALARWVTTAVAVGDLSPADRAAAGADLGALAAADPDTPHTRPLEAAWTLIGLQALGERSAAEDAAAALVASQRSDGGWSSGSSGRSDTSATAAAVQALAALGRPEDRPARDRARGWLAAAQRLDGGWGPTRGRGPSTGLDTAWAALAVWALGTAPSSAPWTRRAGGPLALLARRQNPDGGVADAPNGASVPIVTAMAVLAWRGRPLPLTPPLALAAPAVRRPHLLRRAPAPGGAPGALVSVVYADDPGGTGVDPRGVRIWAGARDVTAQARITAFSLQIPAVALGPLPTVVRLRVPDRAGNVRDASWPVAAPAGGG